MRSLSTTFVKLSILLLLLTLGCSKDRIKPLQIPTVPVAPVEEKKDVFLANPTNIFETLKETPTIKTITDDSQWPVVGKKGTRLYRGSLYDFKFPNGAYAYYPIEIQLTEVFSPKDMILAEMPTVSYGRLLTTAGEINVRAFKDGIELKLNPYSGFRILVPASVPEAMSLFYGEEPIEGFVNWKQANSKDSSQFELGRPPISWLDSMSSYEIFPTKLGWINCDRFSSYSGDKTRIKIQSELPAVSALKKFIYFPGIKSIIQVSGDESLEVPVGEPIKVICFAEKTNGKVFMEVQETTASSGLVVDVKVVEITKQALLDALAGL